MPEKKMAPVEGPFVLHAFFFHHVMHHGVVTMMHHPHVHAVVHHAVMHHTVVHHWLVLRAGGAGNSEGGDSSENERKFFHDRPSWNMIALNAD
jgi:hypothetical protein